MCWSCCWSLYCGVGNLRSIRALLIISFSVSVYFIVKDYGVGVYNVCRHICSYSGVCVGVCVFVSVCVGVLKLDCCMGFYYVTDCNDT